MTTTNKTAEELADIVTSIIVAPYEGENAEVIASKSRGVLVKLFGQYLLAAEQGEMEPTKEMLVAGGRSIGNTMRYLNHFDRAKECWEAMIAASQGIQQPIPVASAPNTPDTVTTATDYQRGFADGVAKERKRAIDILQLYYESRCDSEINARNNGKFSEAKTAAFAASQISHIANVIDRGEKGQ